MDREKLDFKEYIKFEAKTEFNFERHRMRFEQVESSLREAIDYMLRYQWKETRNLVNRALTKVTRPL